MTLFVMAQPLWFHLRGLDETESAEINALIVENGGKVAVVVSPPIMTFTNQKSHIPGSIEFNVQYIRDCVKLGRILDLTPYKLDKPGPYDGCLMSLFIYQHGNCERFIMRSSTNTYGSNTHCTVQEDSIPKIPTAKPSPDTINTIDQFNGVYDNCAAQLDTSDRVESSEKMDQFPTLTDDNTEKVIGSQAVEYFPKNLLSCNEKSELTELARKSPVLYRNKNMEITPAILAIDSSSQSLDIVDDSDTSMEELVLEIPSVTNDVLITNEDIENLILPDTGSPASKSPRLTHKRTEKPLAKGSVIGATDEKKLDKARVSSLYVGNLESHRNGGSASMSVDKDAVPLQNESALCKGGTNVLKTSPGCHQKADKLHSGSTNQKSPVTVRETNVAGRETLRSTTMNQVSLQANAKTSNVERTDKNKSGKIKNVAMKMSDYNVNSDTQFTGNNDMNEDDSPLRDSTVESDTSTDSSDEDDKIMVPRLNISRIKTQHKGDTSEPSTSSAGPNTARIKGSHETDIHQPSTSSARPVIPRNEVQKGNVDRNPRTSSIGSGGGTLSKWYSSRDAKTRLPGKKFEDWERRAIVRYLIKNDCISEVRGLKVWSNMINDNVLPHRTPASLNNHFRKSLIHDVLDYEMSESAKKLFLKVKQKITKSDCKSEQ